MENSTNVKSLTAMFNAAPSPMEGAEKSPGNPPLNSFQARRAEFAKANNLNSGTLPKKPVSPKPPQVPKSASDEIKHPALRPVGINRFGGSVHGPSQDSDVKPTFPKPPGFKTFEQPKDEPKVPFPKPIGNKPLLTTNSPLEHRFGVKPPVPTEEKQKPAFPKPSAIKASSENELKPYVQKKPPFGAKPSSNTVGSPGEVNATKPGLVSKTFSNSLENKPAKQTKETPEENLAPGPTSQSWVPLRPTGVKPLQSPFLKQNPDEPHDRAKQGTPLKDYQAKVNHDGGNSQPPVSKYPRFPSTNQMPPAPDNLREQKDSSEPKRKSLPTPAQLGPPPQKPARPPNVDIERYRSGKTMGSKVTVSEQKSSALSSALPPPPPPVKSLAGSSPIPSLPPRNIRSINEDHKHEDGAVIDDISEESDEECYEGIDDSAQYKREQEEKNEKKRKKKLEQAKREQKEKEKKEQELTKRFRLTEKIEVIHQAQANMDYKGSKNELSFRNGDQIEIIRVTDNPEGKWLGRMKGNYGYIKTAMVKVDYDSLPRKNPKLRAPVNIESDQDIYDDVGEQDSVSNTSLGGNSYFPPPPSNDEDDIYDGVDDGPPDSSVPQEEEKSGTTLWNIFRRRKGTENKKKPVQDKNEPEDIEEDELANSTFGSDVYDDVESCDFPPPPIELGLPVKPSNLGNSLDLKAIKKLEKEEKEFRKKFKFTGDIRILSSVQVVTSLAAKKWGSKDLPLKPGETLDVIQHANDTTLLCKNNEGKYGYVSKSNIIDDDGEIYDDIGENCIYDND